MGGFGYFGVDFYFFWVGRVIADAISSWMGVFDFCDGLCDVVLFIFLINIVIYF